MCYACDSAASLLLLLLLLFFGPQLAALKREVAREGGELVGLALMEIMNGAKATPIA